jgi:DNA repair exonuclease SbcCD nuclease subunit
MDFSQTVIYKLVCNDLNIKECYVGHTTGWKHRKAQHKGSVDNANHSDYNCKKANFIRENGGWSNWSMVEIEKYPCNDKREAGARERYWYETLGAELNTYVPNRSQKEYIEGHKEQIKQYFKKNKEKIADYNKEYGKKYYEKNKDKKKETYELTKEITKLKRKETCQCDCGSIIQLYEKNRHLKSRKHIQYIDSLLLDKPIGEIILDPCETNELTNEN